MSLFKTRPIHVIVLVGLLLQPARSQDDEFTEKLNKERGQISSWGCTAAGRELKIEEYQQMISSDLVAIENYENDPSVPEVADYYRRDLALHQALLKLWQAAKPHKERQAEPSAKPEQRQSRPLSAESQPPSDRIVPEKERQFQERLDNARLSAEESLKAMLNDSKAGASVSAISKDEFEKGKETDPERNPTLGDELWRNRKDAAEFAAEVALHELFGELALVPKALQLLQSDSMMVTPTPQPK